MAATLTHGGAIPQLGVASPGNRKVLVTGALVAASLVGVTIVAHHNSGVAWPQIAAFLPICVTLWAGADLLTAFFLLSQFNVSHKLSLAIIAVGYAVSGLLSIPYLLFFPGLFSNGPFTQGDLQISAWLWLSWHLLFPSAVAAAHIVDGDLDSREIPRDAVGSTLLAFAGAVVAIAALATMVAYFLRSYLPELVLAGGHFSDAYRSTAVPAVVVLNTMACAIVYFRARRVSALQMWLSVALLTMALDGLTNIWAPARYSMLWDVGKIEAVVTSMVVLGMLLFEIATLYRRLYDVASVDTLTGLPNRRSFNERVGRALGVAERSSGVALMVLDVDHFKAYNDRYGHAAGDLALAAVAESLGTSLLRSNDLVARFGGEEFVIFLPEVLVDEVEKIAERVRARVAKLAIAHEHSKTTHLTISVGAVFCSRHQTVTPSALFDFADRALYAAKEAGRNCVVIRHVGDRDKERLSSVVTAAG